MPTNPWKTATFVLAAGLAVQFWWWNKKAPEVLNLSGAPGRFYMR